MPNQGGVPSDGTFAVAGGLFFVLLIIYIAVAVVYIWSYGTLIKAALGQSKWMALLLLIPLVNLVMPVVWGVQAHNSIKEREASGGMEQRPAA